MNKNLIEYLDLIKDSNKIQKKALKKIIEEFNTWYK